MDNKYPNQSKVRPRLLAATKAFYVVIQLNAGSPNERPITNMNAT
jgi:hypothetical protein